MRNDILWKKVHKFKSWLLYPNFHGLDNSLYPNVVIFNSKVIFIGQRYLNPKDYIFKCQKVMRSEEILGMNRLQTLPNRATTGCRVSVTQCAAVNTNVSDIKDPPHE